MQRKIRILIIEDETAIRNGLVDVFVFHGYEVEAAAEGPQGLVQALHGTFDLILLDIMLPGMDGFEICNRIRAEDPEQPQLTDRFLLQPARNRFLLQLIEGSLSARLLFRPLQPGWVGNIVR